MTLGAPSYSFQYKILSDGIAGGTRTINNLNLKMSETDDGVTPADFYSFFSDISSALGFQFDGLLSKIIETRFYEFDD